MSESLAGIAKPVDDLSRDLREVGEGSQRAAQALRDDLTRLRSVLDGVAGAGQRLSSLLVDLEQRTEQESSKVGASLAALHETVTNDAAVAGTVGIQAQAFETAMTEAIGAFVNAVDRLTASLEAVPAVPVSSPVAEPRADPNTAATWETGGRSDADASTTGGPIAGGTEGGSAPESPPTSVGDPTSDNKQPERP
jgi:hypothetical protein